MTDTYKKFAAAWESVENPPLDSINPRFKNKYASIGGVMRVIRNACAGHGIVYEQVPETDVVDGEIFDYMHTFVVDSEGSRIELSRIRMLDSETVQQFGGLITYYRRYTACCDWGIVGEEDDDGNAATPKLDPDYQRQREAKKAALKKQQKKPVTIADTKLFEECASKGVAAEGMWNWYRAQGFGTDDLNSLTAAERKQVESYLKGMRDSADKVL